MLRAEHGLNRYRCSSCEALPVELRIALLVARVETYGACVGRAFQRRRPMRLVTGATGPTGSEGVRQLVARGVRVRALPRDASKAGGLGALAGSKIVVGD